MRIETLDLLVSWWSGGTYGINALLPDVPRKTGHALPADLADIAVATEDALAARWQLPGPKDGNYPLLQVGLGQSGALDPHSSVGKRDGLVQVAFRLADRDEPETATAGRSTALVVQGLEYRLRALEWSLDKWWTVGLDADREGRSVAVLYIEQAVQLVEPFAPVAEGIVVGGGTIVFKVRDTLPEG